MDDYESLSHTKWGLQISRGLHSEVPQEDLVRGVATPSRGNLSPACDAEGVPDRGGASDARSRAHDDLDPSQIRGLSGRGVHQGQERDPSGSGLWGEEAQL